MRRRQSAKVNRTWTDASATWVMAGVTVDTANELLAFEEPAATVFTSMPPEDIIIDRVVGTFNTSLNAGGGNWTLGLLVADRGWVPGVTFSVDSDKRILWHETFTTALSLAQTDWTQSGQVIIVTPVTAVVTYQQAPERMYRVDITPRVRLVAGKALFLVAWENAGALTLAVTSTDMRILWHRARR